MAVNDLSNTWLEAFLAARDVDQTVREAEFIATVVPPNSRVLDLACGYGRHAAQLRDSSLRFVGLDRDARVLPRARKFCPVVQADMRRIPFARGSFDAVISLWQSFGYFSAQENRGILRSLHEIAAPGAILILDLYNRTFFETISGERNFERAGIGVRERSQLRGDRLHVQLSYDNGSDPDLVEWQLFTPATLAIVASECGWNVTAMCRDFDLSRKPEPDEPRIQYVLSRA